MEAMSAGVPVVASDIAGNRDLVIHDETGLLVEVGNRAGFAQMTERILNDPDLATRLSINSIDRMQSEFSIQTMINRYAKYYLELLSK